MIPVSAALDALFALAEPLDAEEIPLNAAHRRWLAGPVHARRTQPPFAASAMDGYALRRAEAEPDAQFQVIGESAAGHGFTGAVKPGQTVRIFTGAPLPGGTDCVVIQEDVTRRGDLIALDGPALDPGHVRPAGADFHEGEAFAPERALTPRDIALLAAMNHGRVRVRRRPRVAIIATGDELVQPGETPGPDQIIASNSHGLAAYLTECGALPRLLPIARDVPQSLETAFRLALLGPEPADLIVTIGGASVGDHDIVGSVAETLGMERAFYKIAMRPGKPLMAGRLQGVPMVGLPGNPVSAMVCGAVFLAPMIAVMLGQPARAMPRQSATLAAPIGPNGPREHYCRAVLKGGEVTVMARQDSALLSVLSEANALVVRPPHDPAQPKGARAEVILL